MSKPWDLAGYKLGQKPARMRVLGGQLSAAQSAEVQLHLSRWLAMIQMSLAPTHTYSHRLSDGSPFKFYSSFGSVDVLVEPRSSGQGEFADFVAWTAQFDTSYVPAIYARSIYSPVRKPPMGYFRSTSVHGHATMNPYTLLPETIYNLSSMHNEFSFMAGASSIAVNFSGSVTASDYSADSSGVSARFNSNNFPYFGTTQPGYSYPDRLSWLEEGSTYTEEWPIIDYYDVFSTNSDPILVFGTLSGGNVQVQFLTSGNEVSSRHTLYIVSGSKGEGIPFTNQELIDAKYAAAPYGDLIRDSILTEMARRNQQADEVRSLRISGRAAINSSATSYLTAGIGANDHVTAALLNIPYETSYRPVAPINYQKIGTSTNADEVKYGGQYGKQNSRIEHTVFDAGNLAKLTSPEGEYSLSQKIAQVSNPFASVVSGESNFVRRYLEHHEFERPQAQYAGLSFSTPMGVDASNGLVVKDASGATYPVAFSSQLGVGIDDTPGAKNPKNPTQLITVFFEYLWGDSFTGENYWSVLPQAANHDSIWIDQERDPEMEEKIWRSVRFEPPSFNKSGDILGVRIAKATLQNRLSSGQWSAPVDHPFKPWQISFWGGFDGLVNAVVILKNPPEEVMPADGQVGSAFMTGKNRKLISDLNKSTAITPQSLIARALAAVGVLNEVKKK